MGFGVSCRDLGTTRSERFLDSVRPRVTRRGPWRQPIRPREQAVWRSRGSAPESSSQDGQQSVQKMSEPRRNRSPRPAYCHAEAPRPDLQSQVPSSASTPAQPSACPAEAEVACSNHAGRTPAEDPPRLARHGDLRPFALRFDALAANADFSPLPSACASAIRISASWSASSFVYSIRLAPQDSGSTTFSSWLNSH